MKMPLWHQAAPIWHHKRSHNGSTSVVMAAYFAIGNEGQDRNGPDLRETKICSEDIRVLQSRANVET
jgi:hypothetical protein